MNNPLNNISTSCQLALSEVDEENNPFTKQMLQTIEQETSRAGEIVRGLLEFSRAQTFSMQPYSLAKLVKKVEQLVAGEIPTGVTIETDIPEDIILFIDEMHTQSTRCRMRYLNIIRFEIVPGKIFETFISCS